jgi:hypothetical protein
MKKLPFILLLVAALIAWFYYSTQQTPPKPPSSEAENLAMESKLSRSQTDLALNFSNANPIAAAKQSTNVTIMSNVLLTNALTATNLQEWTTAIKGLKPLAGFQFQQHWLVEQHGRTNGIPIVLCIGNKTVQYSAVLISILAKNETGDIMEVQMQTSNMNIDQTRELGLQLCDMLGIGPKNFLAWCDTVGNHWLDAPLFGDGNRHYSFHLLHTYNDEKPWSINFMITPNP